MLGFLFVGFWRCASIGFRPVYRRVTRMGNICRWCAIELGDSIHQILERTWVQTHLLQFSRKVHKSFWSITWLPVNFSFILTEKATCLFSYGSVLSTMIIQQSTTIWYLRSTDSLFSWIPFVQLLVNLEHICIQEDKNVST